MDNQPPATETPTAAVPLAAVAAATSDSPDQAPPQPADAQSAPPPETATSSEASGATTPVETRAAIHAELETLRRDLSRLTNVVEEQLTAVAPLCRRLLMDDDERREQARLREVLHEKLEAARPAFQLQLIRPFVQRLATMYDLLADLGRDGGAETRKLVDLLTEHLRETLSLQGIEMVAPASGASFDRVLHFVITTEGTDDPSRHERVARLTQPGFVHIGANDRTGEVRPVVIRPARVVTWKYIAPTGS